MYYNIYGIALLIIVQTIGMAGCAPQGTFKYPHDNSSLFKVDVDSKINVSIGKFQDMRTGPKSFVNDHPLGVQYNRILFAKSFMEDLQEATSISLNSSGLFTVSNESEIDLTCAIYGCSRQCKAKTYTYIPLIGIAIALFGPPAETRYHELSGEIIFYKKQTKQIIYNYKFRKQHKHTTNIYGSDNIPAEILSILYQQAMNEMLKELSAMPEFNPNSQNKL